MNSRLVCIGKTDDKNIRNLLDDYSGRINRYVNFSVVEIPSLRKSISLQKEAVKSAEAEFFFRQVTTDDFVVLLDEKGKEITSTGFAGFLNQRFLSGMKGLVFFIGGAYGVDQRVKDRANHLLSLSRMTFPHQLVRVLFAEQLYRALTILRNEPYHHD